MNNEAMIDFTTVVDDGEKSFIVTIPVQSVIDFLRSGDPSVVMIDGVPMEHRYAGELMLAAQRYYSEHYSEQLHAILHAQRWEPKF